MSYQNNIQEITYVEDHDSFIQNNDKCIMFFGSNECKKCNSMSPIFDDIAKNYPQIKFSRVEVTETTIENLGKDLPVVVCYKNNVPVGKVIGTNKNGIINMIQTNFGTTNQVASRMMSPQNGRNISIMIEIGDLTNYNKFISTNKKCLVFFGSEQCPHCRNIKPKIKQLVNEYPNVKFCHVEVTRESYNMIPPKYQKVGLPLFICYKDNILVNTVIGEDEEGVKEMLQNLS
jgi:thioredoxin 1